MKKVNWAIKLATLPSLILPSFFIISCSNNQAVNALTEEEINKQYEYFANALIKENVKNNLYFENFIFDENNQAILTLEEIDSLLSLQNLSNAYEYQFIIYKDVDNKLIRINMELRIKNSNTNFIEYKKIEKTISSVKSLTLDQKNTLNNIYSTWNQSSNKVTIKNTTTNEVLDPSKFATILPSYLQVNDISFDYSTAGINQTIPNSNIKTNMIFNDYLGQIEWDLSIINSNTGLIFYPDNISNKQMIISGFTNLNDRNKEIIDIFNTLSGRTFSIVTLLGPDKKIPYLSSGVTTVAQFKSMFELINQNLKEGPNQYIDNILQILNDAINKTKWFDLEMTSTANDITGNLVVTWKLIDRFTSYEIFPSNINKITTINNMLTLSKKITENGQEVDDLSAIDNGYKAYQNLSLLEINDKYKELPSNTIISSINIDWLLSNTNIKTLFPDIKKSQDNSYLEFSMTSNNKVNKFRFALDLSQVNDIKPNLVAGTIQLPFIMQIQLEDLFVSSAAGNNPLVKSSQYIDFLPPSGKSDSSNNSSYNSALRSAFISIGGYLTKDLQMASIIYDYFATNKEITININNENYFNEILSKCLDDESQISTVLKTEIDDTILKAILANPTLAGNNLDITKFLEKYKLEFALVKNKLSSYNNTNKIITSSEVEIKIIPNNETNTNIYMKYYKNGVSTTLPKVKFVIKYIPS